MKNLEISSRIKAFLASFLIYGLASAFARFFGLVLTPIYTRVLSPEDYGAIDLVTVTTYFISIFCATEIWAGVAREYNESRNDPKAIKELVSSGLIYILILCVLVIGVIMVFLDPVMQFIGLDIKYQSSLYVAIITIPFIVVFSYFNVLLRFKNRPWPFFWGITIQLVSTTIVSLCLIVVFKMGTWGYFIGQLSGLVAGLAVFALLLKEYMMPAINIEVLKKLLRFSVPIVPAVVAVWLNSYANRFVMLKYLTLDQIGIYAVALKVSSIFMFLEYAFRLAWTPFLYELITEADYIAKIRRIYGVILKTLFILFTSVSLFSKELISILAPLEYSDAGKIAALLCIPAALMILNLILSVGPLIVKKTQYESICQVSGLVFNLTTLFFTIPVWGLTGAAFSYIGGVLITSFLYYYFSRRLVGLNIPKLMTVVLLGMLPVIAWVSGRWDFNLLSKLLFLIFILMPASFLLLYKDRDIRILAGRVFQKYSAVNVGKE